MRGLSCCEAVGAEERAVKRAGEFAVEERRARAEAEGRTGAVGACEVEGEAYEVVAWGERVAVGE